MASNDGLVTVAPKTDVAAGSVGFAATAEAVVAPPNENFPLSMLPAALAPKTGAAAAAYVPPKLSVVDDAAVVVMADAALANILVLATGAAVELPKVATGILEAAPKENAAGVAAVAVMAVVAVAGLAVVADAVVPNVGTGMVLFVATVEPMFVCAADVDIPPNEKPPFAGNDVVVVVETDDAIADAAPNENVAGAGVAAVAGIVADVVVVTLTVSLEGFTIDAPMVAPNVNEAGTDGVLVNMEAAVVAVVFDAVTTGDLANPAIGSNAKPPFFLSSVAAGSTLTGFAGVVALLPNEKLGGVVDDATAAAVTLASPAATAGGFSDSAGLSATDFRVPDSTGVVTGAASAAAPLPKLMAICFIGSVFEAAGVGFTATVTTMSGRLATTTSDEST